MEGADQEIKSNVVLCTAWVPKGMAKANPEKVEIGIDELKEIMADTCGKLSSMKMEDKDANDEDDDDWEDDSEKDSEDEKEIKTEEEDDQEMEIEDEDVEESFDGMYSFKNYENEQDLNIANIADIKSLAVYADPKEDPYLEQQADENEETLSEAENHAILPDDNLIAVGHFENGDCILEVYVYNENTNALYVHHDNLLPEAPLCMEWLNFNPNDNNFKGNLLAVGVMGSVIQVWDLDLIDGLEPAYELHCEEIPRVRKLMKRLAKQKETGVCKYEEYGVMSLAWNKTYDQILASGDTHGVILWDLEDTDNWRTIEGFMGRIQCLEWHPDDPTVLLAGTTGPKSTGKIHMIDCKQEGRQLDCKKGMVWDVKGEVENIQWYKAANKSDKKYHYYILACTGVVHHKKKNIKEGYIYCFDSEKAEPLWSFQPHQSACSNIIISKLCPGLMVTGADDSTLKVWDTLPKDPKKTPLSEPPVLVEELNPQVGQIFTLTASPEQPFVFCMGGNNRSNNFRLWDITTSESVRRVFCPRVGMSVEGKEGNTVKLDPLPAEKNEKEDSLKAGPSKKKQNKSNGEQSNSQSELTKKKKGKRIVKRLNANQ